MATYQTAFLYLLDQNGNSNTGKVDELIADSAASAVESVDDGTVSVGETFVVTFTDVGTNATFGGTYTYIGHATPFSGFVAEDINGEYFLFSNDGDIADNTTLNGFVSEDIPMCFLAGTMIACPGGGRAVETLAIGDAVLTADGRAVPVTWIGRQTVMTMFALSDARRPVAIEAGALAEGVPLRELRVTSDHALLVDGLLVQAGALVDGDTIRRIPNAELGDRFTVFHVETENHELIIAEGVATETFVDNVTRRRFDNFAEYQAIFGEQRMIDELALPRVKSARQVPASIRAMLARRAEALRPPLTDAA